MSSYRLMRRRQQEQSGVRRRYRSVWKWWRMNEPSRLALALRLAGVR